MGGAENAVGCVMRGLQTDRYEYVAAMSWVLGLDDDGTSLLQYIWTVCTSSIGGKVAGLLAWS